VVIFITRLIIFATLFMRTFGSLYGHILTLPRSDPVLGGRYKFS